MDTPKASWFVSLETLNWARLWWAIGILATFWSALAGVTLFIPAFDLYYKVINIVLGALTGAMLFAARGGKYIVDRTEPPPQDGKP